MIGFNFEVNTDATLIDPEWDNFAEQHDRRFGLAIAYLKGAVQGTCYSNKVVELVIGERGFYTQSKNFPAAFYGDTNEATCTFISEEEAQALAWEAVALYRAGEVQSINCVYSDNTPMDVFFGYRMDDEERYELGAPRNALPLHLRIMVDALEHNELLGDTKGVVIYQRTPTGQHLLLKAPGRRQPFGLLGGFCE